MKLTSRLVIAGVLLTLLLPSGSKAQDSPAKKLQKKADKLCEKHKDWSKDTCMRVVAFPVSPGWTEEMVQAKIGKPCEIHVTRTAGHWTAQWVYGSGYPVCMPFHYVYFEDGLVTAVQN